jgi:hypothetical protein
LLFEVERGGKEIQEKGGSEIDTKVYRDGRAR